MNLDLNDLRWFAMVVEHGGFAAAGRVLGLPKSRLSRRIALLEDQLGTRLLQRNTRRLTVTPLGQEVLARSREMLQAVQGVEAVVAQSHADPCGSLRLSCPVALLHARVASLLVSFLQRHPAVQLQVLALDRPVDVVGEGIDIALRVRSLPLPDSDLALRMLGPAPQVLVAAPSLLQALGMPDDPAALAAWPSLALGSRLDEAAWDLQGPDGAPQRVLHRPRLVATDLPMLRQAAVAGLGVVQLPRLLADADLAAGRLVPVLPAWAPAPQAIHAVFATRHGMTPSIRALLDHLAAGFASPAG